jgi:hypothetical protein
MIVSARKIVVAALVLGPVAAIVIACGTDKSTFPEGPPPNGTFGDGSFGGDSSSTGPDLYKNDPLAPWCGPDSGVPAPPILGTEECPEDKNKPGCGCDRVGDTAPCWTGLRRHRNLGVCKDGVATCVAKNETLNVWGECVGQVLPEEGQKGAKGCSCFSIGEWKIANTQPCMITTSAGVTYSQSTVYANQQVTNCFENGTPPPEPMGTAPPGIWSTDTLKADCAGKFKLCFRIKVGDFKNPQPTDCTMGEACTDVDYPTPDVVQNLPDLPTWAGTDNACAKKWEKETPDDVSPGYGEMVVKNGQTVRCDAVGDGDYVFKRVMYCAKMCRNGANPDAQQCQDCRKNSSGEFKP